MRALIQRVSQAQVCVNGRCVGSINSGIVILLGIGRCDTSHEADILWNKITKLRIIENEEGRADKNIIETGEQVLIVSQFTLYASCKKGNRPSMCDAASSDEARALYEYFIAKAQDDLEPGHLATGEFGAMMQVQLYNEGPYTIWLDTDEF